MTSTWYAWDWGKNQTRQQLCFQHHPTSRRSPETTVVAGAKVTLKAAYAGERERHRPGSSRRGRGYRQRHRRGQRWARRHRD